MPDLLHTRQSGVDAVTAHTHVTALRTLASAHLYGKPRVLSHHGVAPATDRWWGPRGQCEEWSHGASGTGWMTITAALTTAPPTIAASPPPTRSGVTGGRWTARQAR